MKSTKFNLISSLVSATLCALLLVFVIFAWYTANDTVKAEGITGMTASSDCIHYKDEVKAFRHNLDGSTVDNTYMKQSDGSLKLVKQVTFDPKTGGLTTITSFASDIYFSITDLLPGEYVDITLGYFMDEECDGYNYNLKLKDITADSFEVMFNDVDYTHYVTGAFKHKSLSLVDEEGNTPTDFTPSTDFTWFSTYQINKDDEKIEEVKMLNHKWLNSYESLYYTFRISEDFSQYYRLVNQSTKSYGTLLSKLGICIGSVYLMF